MCLYIIRKMVVRVAYPKPAGLYLHSQVLVDTMPCRQDAYQWYSLKSVLSEAEHPKQPPQSSGLRAYMLQDRYVPTWLRQTDVNQVLRFLCQALER